MSATKLCDGIFHTSRVPRIGISRQFHIMITKPLKRLTHAPELTELYEHQLDCFADSLVGMNHNLSGSISGVSDRQPLQQLTTTCFRFLSRLQSLPQHLQLDNAQSPFDAQDKLVI